MLSVQNCIFFFVAIAALTIVSAQAHQQALRRADFPHAFVFGTSSSAYQYEGAAREDGKGPSIWDTFSEKKGNIKDDSNGNVANDEYHHYTDDIDLMSEMGMDAYKFSISWSRLIPEGRGKTNQLGIDHYNNLINGLLRKGIQPFVTLYHWDLPQALQDDYGGWLDPHIVDDFANYAEICFKEFGDRVKHWITINEPSEFIVFGYNNGTYPPQRCSPYIGNCSSGNSAKEPYMCAHNVLLSHGAAVDIYRKKYQGTQRGSIGIALSVAWYVPLLNSSEDALAVQRALDFHVGWFLDPIMFGDYPPAMRKGVGDRLPFFSETQKIMLHSSLDFLGVNYYSSYYITLTPPHTCQFSDRQCRRTGMRGVEEDDYFSDMQCRRTGVRDGVLIGPRAASNWLYIVPTGIYNVLNYLKHRYKNPTIYITENGVDEVNNASLKLKQSLRDHTRVEYHKDHLFYLAKAMREGADVRGYFAWSLLDNFEWTSGYTVRFGLYYVDYKTLKRYPKTSVHWFKKFLSKT